MALRTSWGWHSTERMPQACHETKLEKFAKHTTRPLLDSRGHLLYIESSTQVAHFIPKSDYTCPAWGSNLAKLDWG